jgi:hypothetical protein
MLPRITTLLSFLLTAAVATAAAFAAGAFLGLAATSSYVPAIAVVVLAAVLGGIAGDALTRVRTPWAIGVAAGATGLGAVAAYLVAWVAGLSAERRLLLAILFLITALVAAAIWAITSFARRPRSEDAQQVAVARRVAGLGEARGELRVVSAELEGLDGEWGVRVVEVEAICVRARSREACGPGFAALS